MTTAVDRDPKVVVVGSVHMDLVASAPRVPARRETLLGTAFTMHPGGKGGNQAVAAAQQGARTAIVARIGNDPFGHELRAKLASKGVDVANLQLDDDVATGASTVLVGEDGEHLSIIVPGASLELTPDRLEPAGNALRACSVLLVQLEIGTATTAAAAKIVQAAGGLVVFNAAPAAAANTPLPEEFWRSVHLLLVNRDEAEAMSGIPARDDDDAIRACRVLRDRLGVRAVAVTLGGDGVMLLDESGHLRRPGYQVPVVDTIGAGDALAGTVAAALARGETLRRAIELGNAAGALAVGRRGAYDAAPTLADTTMLLNSG